MKNNKTKIVDLLSGYIMLFPNCRLDASGIALYAKALGNISYEEIDAAMMKLLQTCKFYPTVAEIIETVRELRSHIQVKEGVKAKTLTAGECWEAIEHNVRKNYLYNDWEYVTPEVEIIVKRFGKEELCTLKSNEVNTARAQIMRMYNELMEEEKRQRDMDIFLGELPVGKLKQLTDGIVKVKLINNSN